MRDVERAVGQKKEESDEKSSKRHVYVEPGVKIDLVDDLKTEQRAKDKEELAHSRKQLFWTRIGFALVLASTVIAFGIAIIYYYQLDVMQQGMVSVQRAFVQRTPYVNHSIVQRGPKGDTTVVVIDAYWENTGSTPATEVSTFFNLNELPEEPSGSTFSGGQHPPPQPTYIGAKGRFSVGQRRPLSFITGEEDTSGTFAGTRASGRKVFLWGWLVYKDVFPRTKFHLTEFCDQLISASFSVPELKPKLAAPKNPALLLEYRGCLTHNCVDEQCSDYDEIVRLATGRNQ